MSKKSSNKKKYSVIFAVLFVSWLVYFYFFNHYYSDAVDMVTMGAKKEIQILELFYYRGKETIIILASYFFLVSVQTLFVQYLKIKTYVNDDLKKFTLFNGCRVSSGSDEKIPEMDFVMVIQQCECA